MQNSIAITCYNNNITIGLQEQYKYVTSMIEIASNTLLARILGMEKLMVNSFHR